MTIQELKDYFRPLGVNHKRSDPAWKELFNAYNAANIKKLSGSCSCKYPNAFNWLMKQA